MRLGNSLLTGLTLSETRDIVLEPNTREHFTATTVSNVLIIVEVWQMLLKLCETQCYSRRCCRFALKISITLGVNVSSFSINIKRNKKRIKMKDY